MAVQHSGRGRGVEKAVLQKGAAKLIVYADIKLIIHFDFKTISKKDIAR